MPYLPAQLRSCPDHDGAYFCSEGYLAGNQTRDTSMTCRKLISVLSPCIQDVSKRPQGPPTQWPSNVGGWLGIAELGAFTKVRGSLLWLTLDNWHAVSTAWNVSARVSAVTPSIPVNLATVVATFVSDSC
jgi:hypothetical protein